MRTRFRCLILLVAVGVLVAAAAPAGARTVWLCNPALNTDPCRPGQRTTVFSPSGERLRVERVKAVRRPKVDCFYVYPTVSNQTTPIASRRVDPELGSIALYQAARFSTRCRVFAPVYRQVTLAGLLNPSTVTEEMRNAGYEDVRAAWRIYLRRHNRGRGVVLVSHSQGTFVLRRLVAEEIDRRRAVRRKLVSALLLGGSVLVAEGRDTGGDFENVGACRSAKQLGCVVAFSTFQGPVPPDSRFGRPREDRPGTEVLCNNPASLGGGAGKLDPVYPTAPFARGAIGALIPAVGSKLPDASTPWVSVPGSYRARCSSADDANVLQITPLEGAPSLTAVPDATWGLHLVDGNIALGNLTDLVRKQIKRYTARR
ncbi:MAG: DUF3089 domain-containing protein [Thermoleophilaceae bacterium]|nr:DUF3089 domain-containing protein [Thermoleophilaceae bacterium]